MTVAENGAYAKVIFSAGALNVETAVSPNGQRMIWRAGDQIVVANIDGTGRTWLTTCGYNSDPSWSPDGQRIAYHSNCDGGDDVWIMNADGSNQTRSMNGPTTNGTPFWSPDGQWIAFSTNRTGPNDIWIVRPDGTDARPINSDPTLDTYPAWSPDSQQLVWTCGQSLCLGNINAVGAIPIPNTGPFAENAYWGSDGLISFTRLAGNGFNVWTIRPDGTGLRRLTLDNIGANHPLRLP
jgi:TolB protein